MAELDAPDARAEHGGRVKMKAGSRVLQILLIVAVVGIAGGVLYAVWTELVPIFKANAQKRSLLQTGMPASVTILSIEDTGTLFEHKPVLRLTVNVQVQGRPVYRATVLEIVPMSALGMIRPGAQFAARVDRANPQNVAIDWSGQSALPRVEQRDSTLAPLSLLACPQTMTRRSRRCSRRSALAARYRRIAAPDARTVHGVKENGNRILGLADRRCWRRFIC
jgi:hypothetical protein